MRSVVISLPYATKRRELLEQEFNRLQMPFCFYDAVDGVSLTEEQNELVDFEDMRRNARYFPSLGDIGCWLSHMAVIKEFADSDDTVLAVFEDDVRLNERINLVLDALSDDMCGFDIVKLSWHKRHRKFQKMVDITSSISVGIIDGYDNGSEAYVISKQGAHHLIKTFPRMPWAMDRFITRYWENGLTVGIVSPPVADYDTTLDSQISANSYGGDLGCRRAHNYPKYSTWRIAYAKFLSNVRMRSVKSRIIANYRSFGM